jgi:hypothetical protein
MNQLRLRKRWRAFTTPPASLSLAWTQSSVTGSAWRLLSRGGKSRPQRRTTSSSDQPRAASWPARTVLREEVTSLVAKVGCCILFDTLNLDDGYNIVLNDESIHGIGDDRIPPLEERKRSAIIGAPWSLMTA